jgi:hypothetical protein
MKCKVRKIKYAVEKDKKWWMMRRERKIKKCKWWKKGGKNKYEITTGFITRQEHRVLSEQAIPSPYLEDLVHWCDRRWWHSRRSILDVPCEFVMENFTTSGFFWGVMAFFLVLPNETLT